MRKGFTLAEVLITLGIIGVVSAITMPLLIKSYQKQVTINRLKKTYTTLSQAMLYAQNDYGDLGNWDYNLTCEAYMNKYISPYIKKITSSSNAYYLPDGTSLKCLRYSIAGSVYELQIDINGNNLPNIFGKDKFSFYIFNEAKNVYNNGRGDIAWNVKKAGLYPDGYGRNRNTLKNDTWRGCNSRKSGAGKNMDAGAYCTALILYDGWKISNDYDW